MRAMPACELCGLPIEEGGRVIVAAAGQRGSPTGEHLGSLHWLCWGRLRKKLRRHWRREVNLARRADGRPLLRLGDYYVLADGQSRRAS